MRDNCSLLYPEVHSVDDSSVALILVRSKIFKEVMNFGMHSHLHTVLFRPF